MFKQSKPLSLAAGVLAVGVLIVGAPRAAHAIAATLVQVTNTASNPVVAQSPNTQAAQLVELQTHNGVTIPAHDNYPFTQVTTTGEAGVSFVAPPGQYLVITGMDVNTYSPQTSIYLQATTNVVSNPLQLMSEADLQSVGFQQIRYPSGIVYPSGTYVYVGAGANQAKVTVYGYLTNN